MAQAQSGVCMNDITNCELCNRRYSELDSKLFPKVATCCGSTFCFECLKNLEQGNGVCPNCNEDINNVDKFPNNRQINRLLKRLCANCAKNFPLKQECAHCNKSLCTECTTEHRSEIYEDMMAKINKKLEDFSTAAEEIISSVKKDLNNGVKILENSKTKLREFYEDSSKDIASLKEEDLYGTMVSSYIESFKLSSQVINNYNKTTDSTTTLDVQIATEEVEDKKSIKVEHHLIENNHINDSQSKYCMDVIDEGTVVFGADGCLLIYELENKTLFKCETINVMKVKGFRCTGICSDKQVGLVIGVFRDCSSILGYSLNSKQVAFHHWLGGISPSSLSISPSKQKLFVTNKKAKGSIMVYKFPNVNEVTSFGDIKQPSSVYENDIQEILVSSDDEILIFSSENYKLLRSLPTREPGFCYTPFVRPLTVRDNDKIVRVLAVYNEEPSRRIIRFINYDGKCIGSIDLTHVHKERAYLPFAICDSGEIIIKPYDGPLQTVCHVYNLSITEY